MPNDVFKVIIVDDNEDDRYLIQVEVDKVKDYPLEVFHVDGVESFKELTEQVSPDLVISDYNLLDGTALDVLVQLAIHQQEIPVIVISGQIGEEKVAECFRRGAVDYNSKDELYTLYPKVSQHLKRLIIRRETDFRENFFGYVVDNPEIGILVSDEDHNIILINETLSKLVGKSKDELIGKSLADLYGIKPEKLKSLYDSVFLKSKMINREWALYNDKAEFIILHNSVVPMNRKDGKKFAISYVRDTTREKRQAQIRRQSEFISGVCGWQYDLMSNKVYHTERASHIYEIYDGLEDKTAQELVALFDPDTQKKIWDNINFAIEHATDYTIEGHLITPLGNRKAVKITAKAVFQDNETYMIYGTIQDVTEQKEREAELKKLSMVAKNTLSSVIITDADENIEWVNPAFEKLTGYLHEEISGVNINSIINIEAHSRDNKKSKCTDLKRKDYKEESLIYDKSGNPYWVKTETTPLFNDKGQLIKLFSIVEDITQLKHTQVKLQDNIRRLSEAQKIAKVGDWEYNLQTKEMVWSDELYRIYERNPEHSSPTLASIYERSVEAKIFRNRMKNLLEKGKSYAFDSQIVTEQGTTKYIQVVGQADLGDTGEVLALRGTVADITGRKKADIKLRKSEARLRHISNSIDGIIMRYVLEPDGTDHIRYLSGASEQVFGYESKEIENNASLIWQHIPETEIEPLKLSIQESADRLIKWDYIYKYKHPNGTTKWLHGRGTPTRKNNGNVEYDTLVFDVTDLKVAEQQNTVLLQEVHHRVKNNLAIISGLLQLEEFETTNEELILPLKRSRNRIQSMAKVHELIYRDKNLAEMNFNAYLEELIDGIRQYMDVSKPVRVKLKTDDLILNINTAVPLGLLINELLTNSFKYAFTENSGQISVVANSLGKDTYSICYEDNGVGFKKGADFESQTTLGITLIKTLLSQLNAEYVVDTNDGFKLSFEFKAKTTGSHSNIE